MAQTPTTASAMEGMETFPHTETQSASAGYLETTARQWACSRKGYWRIAGSKVLAVALPNGYWTDLGLQGFLDPYRRFREC